MTLFQKCQRSDKLRFFYKSGVKNNHYRSTAEIDKIRNITVDSTSRRYLEWNGMEFSSED